jgi:hypothetical protein
MSTKRPLDLGALIAKRLAKTHRVILNAGLNAGAQTNTADKPVTVSQKREGEKE